MKRHEKKLIKFRKNQNIAPQSHKPSFAKCIVHNFSSYDLSDAEMTALSYDLDTHIPANTNSNTIATKFELFFQNLLRDISNITECELTKIKTKIRNACKNVFLNNKTIQTSRQQSYKNTRVKSTEITEKIEMKVFPI